MATSFKKKVPVANIPANNTGCVSTEVQREALDKYYSTSYMTDNIVDFISILVVPQTFSFMSGYCILIKPKFYVIHSSLFILRIMTVNLRWLLSYTPRDSLLDSYLHNSYLNRLVCPSGDTFHGTNINRHFSQHQSVVQSTPIGTSINTTNRHLNHHEWIHESTPSDTTKQDFW